jgi:hypothetical protein
MVQSCRSRILEQLKKGHLTLQIQNGAAQLTHRERHDSDIKLVPLKGLEAPYLAAPGAISRYHG